MNQPRLGRGSPSCVRQPVSCEPCRRRKIKCSRTRPPCDTCLRRGCTDNCIYLGNREDSASAVLTDPNQELLNRISNLESLLRKHTGEQIPHTSPEIAAPMLSPPSESIQPFGFSPLTSTPESYIRHSQTSEGLSPHSFGVLRTSSGGNVSYEPRSSQWTSVLANTSLSTTEPSLGNPEDSTDMIGFPLATSATSTLEELLSLLPPIQQCDYLKNTYFSVFSPVCVLQVPCPYIHTNGKPDSLTL